MKIRLNGSQREVADTITVSELLAMLSLRSEHVAVEVNREVVPRGKHSERALAEGDSVEVVTLVGGG